MTSYLYSNQTNYSNNRVIMMPNVSSLVETFLREYTRSAASGSRPNSYPSGKIKLIYNLLTYTYYKKGYMRNTTQKSHSTAY